MAREDLKQEWVNLATAWIHESREGRNPTREALLDPPMLKACGDLHGKHVLDLGCGEGRFCRIALKQGAASATGVDLCEPMINAARELQTERDTYILADAQDLSFLDDAQFDLAVSYLNQCDLEDFEANSREVLRVLKPGGVFIIANVHPMHSAESGWLRNSGGKKLFVAVDNYFDEGERHWKMMGQEFTNFHRTIATQINTYLRLGFVLEGLQEPTLSPEMAQKYPEMHNELRVPNFIIFALRKPH